MAHNMRKVSGPTLEVKSCVGAHGSGDLAFEAGKFGIAVETSLINARNTFYEHGWAKLPVPAGTTIGTAMYAIGVPANGATVQSFPNTYRSTAVASNLTATAAGNTYIGRMVSDAFAEGATTVGVIELLPQ